MSQGLQPEPAAGPAGVETRPIAGRLTVRGVALSVAAAALVLATVLVQFTGLVDRPAGYYIDESSFSYNAWTLATKGVDEHGRSWPLFFEAFGDWKTWPYIYLLAGVFSLTGPSVEVARFASALAGVATVALTATLALRVTRRPEAALLAGFTVLLLPWTFEPTRLALEVAFMPALVAAYLFALYIRPPTSLSTSTVILLAGLLALITYTYTLGRLLGPLLALGLLAYVDRRQWRGVATTWTAYAILLVPLGLFMFGNPEAATVRFEEAGYLNRPPLEFLATFAHQYLGNLDPVRWLLTSDPNLRHHVPGIMGSMLVGTLVLGLIGLDRAIHCLRSDAWSRYLVFGLVVAFIPASLTLDVFHVHRLIAVPVFVVALGILAQRWLLQPGRGPWRKVAFALLAAVTIAQGAYFQLRYDEMAPARAGWLDAAFPVLFEEALATAESPIYLEDGMVPVYTHGYWYGAVWDVEPERLVRLRGGTRAPAGALVLSSEPECPEPCENIVTGGFFRLYRVLDQ